MSLLLPHVIIAPPPWEEEWPVPYELVSVRADRCPRCQRAEVSYAREVGKAREIVLELAQLLDDKVATASAVGFEHELLQASAVDLEALLTEYQDHGQAIDDCLSESQAAVDSANRKVQRARAFARRERKRAAQASASLASLRNGDDLAAARTALAAEKRRTARYQRYVQALEAHIRRIAERDPTADVGGDDLAAALAGSQGAGPASTDG